MSTLIPIDSVSGSGNVETDFNIIKIFDGKIETYWKPSINKDNLYYIQLNYFSPHVIECFDIAFNKGDERRYIFSVYIPINNHWLHCRTIETSGETNDIERYNLSIWSKKTKSIKFVFTSFMDKSNNNIGIIPEVSELRVYGVLNEREVVTEFNNNIPKLPCPRGYIKKGKKCIKDVKLDILDSQIKILNGVIVVSFKDNVKVNMLDGLISGDYLINTKPTPFQTIVYGDKIIFDKPLEVNRIELSPLIDVEVNTLEIKCYGEK